ncbi:hypothetical protein NTE_03396 [Candidatus Nitrososphaera evergladensis SR1]|uniref:Uncharacterized protein n=1 Tax=Candidatus Nitrososphaera evergladensis SR1 TaxID=1459636 RepID=A0A075N1U1_9ARCH|nr:hypothetical protein [Candidatus Nitrososphaera evergladensis]AIF85424.1 hypothetical protein NTE_03396 [Candidatus Nitrososphaera evergladensis SR1]
MSSNSEAPATADKPSETQRILKELAAAIDSGSDLTNKETRVRVCHDIEARLQVPYGNVTKQVNRALREAAQKAGAPPASVKRNLGGSTTEVKIPPLAQAEQAATSTEPAARSTEPAAPGQQASQPQRPENAILAKYNNLEELMAGPEYQRLYLTFYSAFSEVHGMYARIGIPPFEEEIEFTVVGSDGTTRKQKMLRTQHLAQQWALAMIKFGWDFPPWLEKGMLIGGTLLTLAMPPLAHFGLLDDIKSGFGRKNKKDAKPEPEKSENPL